MGSENHQASVRQIGGQFLRFSFVGVINSAVAYAGYAVLLHAGAHHQIALVFDYLLGLVLGFWLNLRFTFLVPKSAPRGEIGRAFGRMVISNVPILAINIALLEAAVRFTQLNHYLAQLLIFGGIAICSFLVQRIFVFSGTKEK